MTTIRKTIDGQRTVRPATESEMVEMIAAKKAAINKLAEAIGNRAAPQNVETNDMATLNAIHNKLRDIAVALKIKL